MHRLLVLYNENAQKHQSCVIFRVLKEVFKSKTANFFTRRKVGFVYSMLVCRSVISSEDLFILATVYVWNHVYSEVQTQVTRTS